LAAASWPDRDAGIIWFVTDLHSAKEYEIKSENEVGSHSSMQRPTSVRGSDAPGQPGISSLVRVLAEVRGSRA